MPSPDTVVSFRSKELVDLLDGYSGREQRNQIAKQLMERYQLLMVKGLPKLN